ncbi:hypothetical protein PaG_00912 [Moesziomyces aphidis]|uniref:Zn(2)-C6 fungal-type domain-containing protein n=1 Tax=Moesziomyces aphidis TaxID=84754 RepID=W3VUI4_MOEAP|nr:hypothetical protein PaG_00912 [Moesziomyces aphidis]
MAVTTAAGAANKSRSMNRSCIQCRERKIKCDRLDPCSQCTSKGATDQCRRELRKKRAKNKRPFPKRKTGTATASTLSDSTVARSERISTTSSPGAQPTSWADGSMGSASRHSQTCQTPSSASGKASTPNTSSSAHDSSYLGTQEKHTFISSSHHPRSSAPRQQQQASLPGDLDLSSSGSDESDESDDDEDNAEPSSHLDDRLHILEANQLMALNTAPEARCPFALKDVYAEWKAMPLDRRRGLIYDIRSALPTVEQSLHLLHSVYVKRIHSLYGNVVHVPSVHLVLAELLTDPNFEMRERYAMGPITTALMVIFAALRAAPLDRNYTWPAPGSSGTHIQPLSQREIRQRQKKIYILVRRIQAFESNFTFGSISELQTAVLMLACGKGSPSFFDSLADCAIRSAMRMRIHRLGSLERMHSPHARPSQVVTGEMAVRCWWALVRRDWSQSSKHRSYRIAPSQFNTRLPLNLFDDELITIPVARSHLRSTWTPVSYSLAIIDFAIMTRSLVDHVNSHSDLDDAPATVDGWGLAAVYGQRLPAAQRDSLDQLFQSLISAFPAHYSLDARYDDIAMVDVERWLLHQRLFHLFLTLHMPLISEAARPHGSLMYMANHILDIQDKVSGISTLLDNTRVNTLQMMRACLVLLLDLFFTEAPARIGGLSRLMTRRKITAALERTPMETLSSTTKLSIQLVQILLLIEEQQHRSQTALSASTAESPLLNGSAQEASVGPAVDAATLRSRWHATCQILDVLLNDGYWRSFRKNLLSLDHLIPDWLQQPLREGVGTMPQSTVLPRSVGPPAASTIVPNAASEPSFPAQIERGFDAGNAEAILGPIHDAGLLIPFDASLFDDLETADLATGDNSSPLPQLDVDLLGQLDFEGYGNSSQSLDFAKMLMDWRVDVPLAL